MQILEQKKSQINIQLLKACYVSGFAYLFIYLSSHFFLPFINF